MSLNEQFITMLAMLLSGVGMGMVFDGYRVVALQLHFPKWTKPVLDFMYWLVAVCFVFRVLYLTNQGDLRFYVFIGLFLGVWFYFLWFSFTTVRIVVILMKALKQLVRFVKVCLDILLVRPVLLIYKLIRVLFRFLLAFVIFIGKIVLQLLRPFWKLLRWMTSPLWRRIKAPIWLKQRISSIAEWWKRWRKRE